MKKSFMLTLTALSVAASSALTFQPALSHNSVVTAYAEDGNNPVTGEIETEYGTIYYTIDNGEVTINRYNIKKGEYYIITLPSEIDGYPVTEVGDNAIYFVREAAADGIVFPESIKKIGNSAVNIGYDRELETNNLKWIWLENPDIEIPVDGSPIFGERITVFGKKDSDFAKYAYKNNINYIDCETAVRYDYVIGRINDGEITITSCYDKAKSVTIPSEINGMPVTSIGQSAFYCSKKLEEIVIPDSVKSIDSLAFSSCPSLKSVYIPDSVSEIGSQAFSCCGNLNDVRLPESLTQIPTCCFENSKALMEINIPKSCTEIGESAFEGCTYMEEIVIPDGVATIGPNAFRGCRCLKEITIPDSVTRIGSEAFAGTPWAEKNYNDDELVIINGCLVDARKFKGETLEIPDTVHSVSAGAFKEIMEKNETIKSIIIPDSVTEIDSGCFADFTALESVRLPDTLKVIPDGCFGQCTSLKEINIPAKLEKIGNEAFLSCEKLEKAVLPDTLNEIGHSAFKGCMSLKEINIPLKITEIPYNCFCNCSSLEKIPLHEKIKTIGSFAFTNCDQLKDVELPDGIEEIRDHAFSNCKGLESIKLPDNVKLGGASFYNCTSLAEVTLPSKTESILSHNMFTNTPWLENLRKENSLIIINNQVFDGTQCEGEVVIPEGVTGINDYAFSGSSITSVTFPDSLKYIGSYAFQGCDNIEEFTIPDFMEKIPSGMLSSCDKLKKVNIPDSVTDIGVGAFNFCTGFTEFTVPATVKYVDMSFACADNLKTITFLNPECTICFDSNIFETMPYNTTVRGYADSTAYWYAYFNKRDFELIDPAGDANCDGELSMADAVLIMQSISNPDKYGEKGTGKQRMTEQGKKNADITGENDGVTNADALAIQKKLLKLDK